MRLPCTESALGEIQRWLPATPYSRTPYCVLALNPTHNNLPRCHVLVSVSILSGHFVTPDSVDHSYVESLYPWLLSLLSPRSPPTLSIMSITLFPHSSPFPLPGFWVFFSLWMYFLDDIHDVIFIQLSMMSHSYSSLLSSFFTHTICLANAYEVELNKKKWLRASNMKLK